MSPARSSRRASNIGDVHARASQDVKELLNSQRLQKKWEEELAEEIKRTRGKCSYYAGYITYKL